MFAALADNEKYYEDRINFFGALAPISRIYNVKHPALKIFRGIESTAGHFLWKATGINEIAGPKYEKMCSYLPKICGFVQTMAHHASPYVSPEAIKKY